jgi:hypothetical protein
MKKDTHDKWVICLGAGDSQVSLITNAQSLGYKVLAIDRNPDAKGFKFSDDILIESTHNSKEILSKISQEKWHGLLSRCTGNALFTAADITKTFGLYGVTHDLAEIGASKSALREFCFKNDIRAPYGLKIKDSKEFNSKNFTDQIIIKPDFTLVGKKSITKLNLSNKVDVKNAIESALSASGNNYVEAEDFIEGYDCSFLSWIEDGSSSILFGWDELIGFDKCNNLFQHGISMPSISSIDNKKLKKIEETLNHFATFFLNTKTLIAFSFRVDSDGSPWLIEVHADLTGDLILDKLVPASIGNDILLDITKLFIQNESDIDLILENCAVQKPTAVLFNKNYNNNGVKIINENNLFDLHHKINKEELGIVLEQKYFLDKEESKRVF